MTDVRRTMTAEEEAAWLSDPLRGFVTDPSVVRKGDRAPKPAIRHGLASSYTKHRCRCDPCTDAWADYQRDYMRRYRSRR